MDDYTRNNTAISHTTMAGGDTRTMSKEQKTLSERKHKMVHRYLTEQFPGCKVEYDGVEGVDHKITFNDITVFLETKTCTRIIKAGVKPDETGRPILHQKFRLGTFKFNQKQVYPYKKSQHEDLVDQKGWYIFVVENRIRGAPAKLIDERIHGTWDIKRIAWDRIIFLCYPNWLEDLKMQVYNIDTPWRKINAQR